MRFFFFNIFYGEGDSGVNKKVVSQVQLLNEHGVEAKLVLIGDSSNLADSPFIIREDIIKYDTRSIFSRIISSRKIAKVLQEYIRKLGSSDILYIRYPLYIPFCPVNFFKPFRKCKVVFEHNTHIQRQYLLNREYLALFLEFVFGNIVLLQADGGVGMTEEMTDSVRTRIGERIKPFITIPNGISVGSVRMRTLTGPAPNQKITLLCVANFNPWHGIDRLILGMARYSGNCSISLHLVGGGSAITDLKELCTQNKLAGRVIFHDFLTGPDLDRLFDESHIAVGTLAIHRINLIKSSTLKSREYCARGIPYIMGSEDPDFPDDFPYILRIHGDDTPVDMEQVIKFASRICQDSDHPKKMRQYAVEHLDWSIKMEELKKYLEEKIIKREYLST
jgi:glycosyltransferase involved in cell wall biosynthesis